MFICCFPLPCGRWADTLQLLCLSRHLSCGFYDANDSCKHEMVSLSKVECTSWFTSLLFSKTSSFLSESKLLQQKRQKSTASLSTQSGSLVSAPMSLLTSASSTTVIEQRTGDDTHSSSGSMCRHGTDWRKRPSDMKRVYWLLRSASAHIKSQQSQEERDWKSLEQPRLLHKVKLDSHIVLASGFQCQSPTADWKVKTTGEQLTLEQLDQR